MLLPASDGQRIVGERELELLLVADVLADAFVAATVQVDDGRPPRHVLQRKSVRLELDTVDR